MIKIPLYPPYSTITTLLKILQGRSVAEFKSMWTNIWDLRGTPQNTVDWTDPDTWIEQRLKGKDKMMALAIWQNSQKRVNPRWTRGDQFLMNGYKLIDDVNGSYEVTDRGNIFISGKDNAVAREIDEQEGLFQLLLQAAALSKGKRADFLPEWQAYLDANSNVKKDSVAKDYLRRRLVNLWDRNYLKREGNNYQITEEGLVYLNASNLTTQNQTQSKLTLLSREMEQFKQEQRKMLRIFLENVSPVQFEQVVKDLLIAIGYEDVLVTSPTNDKGVDVTAVSQQGITTVKEVIQVKRFVKGNVGRPVLDSLRGSLHRFDEFQGSIITLSDFAQGAKDAAYEKGAAPITLINGEKLIDLLIQYNLVIKKKTFDYFVVDEDYFVQADTEIE
jgi:restriction system protein